MPQTIAAAIVSAIGIGTAAGSAIVVSSFALSIITGVIALGITWAAMSLITAVFGPSRPRPSDGQQVVRQAVGSRTRNYGIVHTGGTLSFFESSGGTLGQVVTLGTGHESGEIIEHRINDKVVNVADGTVSDASYHSAVHIYTRPGDPDQTAIAELTAKFPIWTSAHRQRGCAHVAIIADPVKQELFSEVYNSQVPQYTQVRKGVKLYDPRLDGSRPGGSGPVRLTNPSAWPWSDNAALVIADYLAHPDGFGIGYANINWDNIAAEADICEQTISTVSGETVARWRLWAGYNLAQSERRQVLADMLIACDGFCWQGPDFKFNLMVGRYVAPTVTITDDHILAMAPSLGPKAQQRVSAIKVLYTEAAIGYREQESATVIVPDVNEDPNTDPQTVQAFYAPHHNQAVRIGKLKAAELGQRWRIPVTLNLFGLNLLAQRTCRFESAQFDLAIDCKIESPKLNTGNNTIEAVLTEIRESDWSFNAAYEEGTPPASSSSVAGTISIPTPTDLAVAAIAIALADGGAGVAIAASWTAGSVRLSYQCRYRAGAGGTWVMMATDSDACTATSGAVSSGVEYEVQVRALTLGQRASAWSASELITPSAAAALEAPSALAATGGSGSATISFRMPVQPSLAYARLYRSTTTSFADAVQVGGDIVGALGQVMSISDTGLSAGTKRYWVRAFNTVGASSALAGPASATIT